MKNIREFKAVVIGVSAGGLNALQTLLKDLPADYSLPFIIVQHRSKGQNYLLEEVLQSRCKIQIKQANEKEQVLPGVVYIAPPDYHLLIENDKSFSLSTEEQVNFSRPSIDILFESAAVVFQKELLAIILTGANHDGAAGIKSVYNAGGTIIIQNPEEAEFPVMPLAAISTGIDCRIWKLHEIKLYLLQA